MRQTGTLQLGMQSSLLWEEHRKGKRDTLEGAMGLCEVRMIHKATKEMSWPSCLRLIEKSMGTK
jgi:hypothetical protein